MGLLTKKKPAPKKKVAKEEPKVEVKKAVSAPPKKPKGPKPLFKHFWPEWKRKRAEAGTFAKGAKAEARAEYDALWG